MIKFENDEEAINSWELESKSLLISLKKQLPTPFDIDEKYKKCKC